MRSKSLRVSQQRDDAAHLPKYEGPIQRIGPRANGPEDDTQGASSSAVAATATVRIAAAMLTAAIGVITNSRRYQGVMSDGA